MTPDRARQAVAVAIASAIPDNAAEMIAGWTEAQWRGFLVGIAAASPGMWGSVQRGDLAGVFEASVYGDEMQALAELAAAPPPDPTASWSEAELFAAEPCQACQGLGFVRCAGGPHPAPG